MSQPTPQEEGESQVLDEAGRSTALVDVSTESLLDCSLFTLHDLEAIRSLLRGGSVVDWRRSNFGTLAEVDSFLRVSGFDPERPKDRVRLHTLHRQAVVYLKENLHFAFPEELSHPESVAGLFLVASDRKSQNQQLACSILKVMHIINHMDARELRTRLTIPDQELFRRVEQKVLRAVNDLSRRGIPLDKLLPSLKEHSSVITKLLSKRRTLAAEIYDRIRFRIITERLEDILPTIRHLLHQLFPFNYVVPEESRNDVLDFREALESNEQLARFIPELQFPLQVEDRSHTGMSFNEFSARSYCTISFVVDIPLRVDNFMPPEGKLFDEFGPLVYVKTEFQMMDRETSEFNEKGEGSHEEYKRRQLNRVQYRLTHGVAPVPGHFTPPWR